MAGRGRAMTLPAWMNKEPASTTSHAASDSASLSIKRGYGQNNTSSDSHSQENGPTKAFNNQFEINQQSSRKMRRASRSRSPHDARTKDRGNDLRHSVSQRSKDPDRDRDRKRDRHREREKHQDRTERRKRSGRSRSRSNSESRQRERRHRRKSNFDVRPPGVTEENAAAYAAQAILQHNMAALSGAVGPASFGPPPSNSTNQNFNTPMAQQTRHARRIYVGGIGEVNEMEISAFFNDVIDRALGELQEGGAVVSVYINRERHFAFVELKSIELTTACMNLDGIAFRGQPLKIRRPNDYNPGLVPKDLGPIPALNLAALGIVSTTVQDGPGKVFIGGIPYHLSEEQIKELLQAFGPLKSFHLVKDLTTNLSKGYAFCEYMDSGVTDAACIGLNDMKLGDRTLTVRRALSQESAKVIANAAGTVNAGVEMGLDPSRAAMQTISMAGVHLGPIGSPSRVLVLRNMVTPEELEDEDEFRDIMDDIRSECERYGPVTTIILPRVKEGYGDEALGKVYIEFGDISTSQAAANELHGRGFANRVVSAQYMEEAQFGRRELT